MELDVEELEGLKRKLIIEIPEEVVSKRINKAYSQLNQQIKMPGFRPGKIPRGLLEKQVPVQSFTQMFQELMQEYYEKALQESGIIPAGPPEMDHSGMQDIKKDSPLSFSVRTRRGRARPPDWAAATGRAKSTVFIHSDTVSVSVAFDRSESKVCVASSRYSSSSRSPDEMNGNRSVS